MVFDKYSLFEFVEHFKWFFLSQFFFEAISSLRQILGAKGDNNDIR